MRVLRWLAVSFSLYSRIPMPRFEWSEDDYGHSLFFFPIVGAVIGMFNFMAYRLLIAVDAPIIAGSVLLTLIPIIVTGGFHLDGFMDTTDARSSYLPRADKLRILKDPHTGAFAVIGLISCVLAYMGAAGVLLSKESDAGLCALSISFIISRALSGIISIRLPKAKSDGMLNSETKDAGGAVSAALWIQLILAAGTLVYISVWYAILIIMTYVIITLYYRHMTYKEFGGVTGDTAGYFVTLSETLVCVAAAIMSLFV